MELTVVLGEARAAVALPPGASVGQLAAAVRRSPQLAASCEGRALRLLAMGRILSDEHRSLEHYRVGPGTVVHAVLTSAAPPPRAAGGASCTVMFATMPSPQTT